MDIALKVPDSGHLYTISTHRLASDKLTDYFVRKIYLTCIFWV